MTMTTTQTAIPITHRGQVVALIQSDAQEALSTLRAQAAVLGLAIRIWSGDYEQLVAIYYDADYRLAGGLGANQGYGVRVQPLQDEVSR